MFNVHADRLKHSCSGINFKHTNVQKLCFPNCHNLGQNGLKHIACGTVGKTRQLPFTPGT